MKNAIIDKIILKNDLNFGVFLIKIYFLFDKNRNFWVVVENYFVKEKVLFLDLNILEVLIFHRNTGENLWVQKNRIVYLYIFNFDLENPEKEDHFREIYVNSKVAF